MMDNVQVKNLERDRKCLTKNIRLTQNKNCYQENMCLYSALCFLCSAGITPNKSTVN